MKLKETTKKKKKQTKNEEPQRQYKYKLRHRDIEGKPKTTGFDKLPEAREVARTLFRAPTIKGNKRFISLTNLKGVFLTI